MGERTFINSLGNTFNPVPKPKTQTKPVPGNINIDIILLLTVLSLSIFGILMVYSTTFDFPDKFFGQCRWFVLSITVMIFCTFLDYHLWQKIAVWLLGGTIFLLFIIFIYGRFNTDPTRALFGESGRPSELAKIALVIYLSVWLIAKRDQLKEFSFGLIPLGIILGIVGTLILSQPDLSAAFTVFFLGAIMFFLAGCDLRQFTILMAITILAVLLFITISRTGQDRMADFRLTIADPTLAPPSIQITLGSFIRGGWFGVGIGKGVTKLTSLPLPHSDSIFAVIGEETGVFGTLVVLFLFLIVFWRSLIISKKAPDEFGHLLAAGLGFWITMEVLMNMGVMVGLLPAAGNSLPFISYGGSNLAVSFAAIGILLNISRLSSQSKRIHEEPFDAVVDLRGGDRRRRVSRPDRPASYHGNYTTRH